MQRIPGGGGHIGDAVTDAQGQAVSLRHGSPYAGRTATMASISTAAPRGSTATPTALRACLPLGPNTASISSDAPLATCGWSVKAGVELTKTPSFTMRSTRAEITAQRAADLRDQHHAAQLCGVLAASEIDIIAQPPRDKAAVVAERQLAGNVEQATMLNSGHIGGHWRGGSGQGQAEFGEAGRNIVHFQSFQTVSMDGAGRPASRRAAIQSCASAQRSMRAWAWRDGLILSEIAGSPTICSRHTSGACSATEV